MTMLLCSTSFAEIILEGPAVAIIKEDEVTIEWTTSEPTSGTVEYGPSRSFGQKKDSKNFHVGHTVTLKNLKSKTRYFFKITAHNKKGKTVNSDVHSFQTEVSAKLEKSILKIISQPQVTVMSPHEVIISWETNLPTFGHITYGIQEQKPVHYATHQDTKIHIISLNHLVPGSRYFYQVQSESADGQKVTSSYASFMTHAKDKKALLPSIIEGPAIAIRAADELKIEWKTDRPCQSTIGFGKAPFPSFQIKKSVHKNFSKNHVFRIDQLKKKTRYFYTIYLKDQQGKESTSDIYSVTTESFD